MLVDAPAVQATIATASTPLFVDVAAVAGPDHAALLVVLCLSIIWFSRSGGAHLERRSYHLSEEARQVLKGQSTEAGA